MRNFKMFLILCASFCIMTPVTTFAAAGTVIAQNNTQDEDLSIEAMIDGASYILSPANEYRATFTCNTRTTFTRKLPPRTDMHMQYRSGSM